MDAPVVFTIEKTIEIINCIKSDQKISIESDYPLWCNAADTLMFMHESLSADEAMAIAIEYHDPKWENKLPAEREICDLGEHPLGIYTKQMIKMICRSHPTLTYEEWFIIAKLQFGQQEQ
jgi:hypothetical protein